jgi:dihydrofolate reductase
MRKVILYIANSLDNFIASEDGSLDWLFSDSDYGYYDFLATIDCTLMGNKTYQHVLTFEGEFPYKDKENYVFTRNTHLEKDENVRFISTDIQAFVKNLTQKEGKNIWCIGGGEVNRILLQANLIDEMILSIHPILLGKGIPMFPPDYPPSKWKWIKTQTFESGLVQLHYSLLK